jgi:hypothetical protein
MRCCRAARAHRRRGTPMLVGGGVVLHQLYPRRDTSPRRAPPPPMAAPRGCHTRLSEENQVQTYMHARIKFHAYSDI